MSEYTQITLQNGPNREPRRVTIESLNVLDMYLTYDKTTMMRLEKDPTSPARCRVVNPITGGCRWADAGSRVIPLRTHVEITILGEGRE